MFKFFFFFFSSRRRHTRLQGDWSSDVCSSDLTRRRFSGAWHEEVLQTLKRDMPQYFAGSSNVWFAMRNNLTPLGTLGHEYMQACQALGPRLRDSQTFALDKWAQEYRGDLGIAISDTYGVDAFLRDFDMYFCK